MHTLSYFFNLESFCLLQAVDAVYFNGANREGGYFVGATARRHDKLTQTLLYIRVTPCSYFWFVSMFLSGERRTTLRLGFFDCQVPRLGLLELPSLPDTSLFREEEMTFAANGFKIQPVEPMKKWKLTFNGKMRWSLEGTFAKRYRWKNAKIMQPPSIFSRLIRTVSEQEEVHVEFSFDWTAGPGYFDFDTDMHTHAMCEAMSRELWSKDFFERLKEYVGYTGNFQQQIQENWRNTPDKCAWSVLKRSLHFRAHQTHYEQFGELRGKLKIGELEDIDFSVQGVRDHSYGKSAKRNRTTRARLTCKIELSCLVTHSWMLKLSRFLKEIWGTGKCCTDTPYSISRWKMAHLFVLD